MKPYQNDKGYLAVAIHHEGKRYTRMVHRVVCETFHGPKPTPEHQVRHRDSNSLNNHYSNLCWGLPPDQVDDRVLNGTLKLSRTDATEIRKLYATRAWRHTDLADHFKVDRATIGDVLRNEHWYDPDYTPLQGIGSEHRSGDNNHAAELTWPLVREIRAKYTANPKLRHEDLAAEYGVVKATITYLLANVTWVDPDYVPSSGKPRTKMTAEWAEDIRRRFAGHTGTRTVFAQQEGISAGLLSDILNGKRYAPGK